MWAKILSQASLEPWVGYHLEESHKQIIEAESGDVSESLRKCLGSEHLLSEVVQFCCSCPIHYKSQLFFVAIIKEIQFLQCSWKILSG